MSNGKLIEGVFGELEYLETRSSCTNNAAINKPKSLTSAQVVRDLQRFFTTSKLFAPLLSLERAKRDEENIFQRKRRKDKRLQVKIGHGGTLDPLATGVLIIGVGKGTKQLQRFLECTKSYEATLLLGAATDTYDVIGRVLSKAPYSHVTKEDVETALKGFRGNIMQKPPYTLHFGYKESDFTNMLGKGKSCRLRFNKGPFVWKSSL